ncbi:glycoside hydrolase family 99-like domain-containing protein [Butyrivibrio fibrisolvens]|uniref:glycoside hydrolase family 99-like domain-containing protein n=1 Tax=Butyrivibrio fibrisolvens TaxID=831 RepID=UPI000424A39E|nr:glycoside hydrolase family 99-like domain-containing protein [Butyrivibrio fibrisolvens]
MRIKYLIHRGLSSLKHNGIKRTFGLFVNWLHRASGNRTTIARKADANSKAEYIVYLEKQQMINFSKNSPDFVPLTKSVHYPAKGETKLIAFYLPQYYQMEVNNKYHGQGFTEWSNSSQALPQFTGHYQPHIPYDVGFYDLTTVSALKRQAELAKMYGIYGFCMHWYWFSGERTMEEPPRILLEHPEIDIHYCFDWATENWTSAWDGGNKGIIFEQKLDDGDEDRFMQDILPYMHDERYIKIDGRPVLSIYRCDMFGKERFLKAVSRMREIAKAEGFPDLYLMLTNREFNGDVKDWGFDALVEFPPAYIYPQAERYKYSGYVNPNFKADMFDITSYIEDGKFLQKYGNNEYFRSALVSFDNTSRRATTGCQLIMNDTPEIYEKWLTALIEESKAIHSGDSDIVFINSWNEWAEGSHLEPDMKYGYAYLQATKNALEHARDIQDDVIETQIDNLIKKGIEDINIYIECIESMGDIVASEPVARYLKGKAPKAKITWIVKRPFEAVVRFNPLIDEIKVVDSLGESMDFIEALARDEKNVIVNLHFDGRQCNVTYRYLSNPINAIVNEKTYLNYGSLLESFCLSAGMKPLDEAPRFYLDPSVKLPEGLPEKYVVFHCKSAESTKDWTDGKWNVLACDFINQGVHVVELGLEPIIRNRDEHYHDLTDIHDLQQIAKIIQNAQCFIGVDSGFAHFANAFGVYGILIFGKYKNFSKPMMYTGAYKDGSNANIIYADNDAFASEVEEKKVLNAYLQKFMPDCLKNDACNEGGEIQTERLTPVDGADYSNEIKSYIPFKYDMPDVGGQFGNATFSQFGDDLVVMNIFERLGIKKPSFLDIGAHHPFVMSNTALLYKNGSRGINVEADKDLIPAFLVERKEDTNVLACVDAEEGEKTFYKIPKAPGCSTIVKNRASAFINERPEFGPIEEGNTKTVTMDKIVMDFNDGVYPDFLNLNVGGNEYAILKSSTLLYSNGPAVIDVEVDGNEHEKVKELLGNDGYVFFMRVGVNDIYLRERYSKCLK